MANRPGDTELRLQSENAREAAEMPKPARKRFGEGREYQPLFNTLAERYATLQREPSFLVEVDRELIFCAGRPSSLFHARRLSARNGGAQIYIKREDLMPAGTMLVTAITGQALFAKRLGCKQLVTASKDGQKGVAMAAVAARLGLDAVVYMDGRDAHRQSANVFRMWLSGASVEMVDSARQASGDVRDVALRHWLRNPDTSFLVMGLDAAPDPYPAMTLDFVAAVGRETRLQVRSMARRAPDLLVARAGNNADALGFFQPFLVTPETRLLCVNCVAQLTPEARGQENVLNPVTGELSHPQKRVAETILEGLEYPSVDREHRVLKKSGRVDYLRSTGEKAKRTIGDLARLEGLIPAVQTAQVIACATDAAARMPKDHAVVVNMVEHVDKDIWDIGKALGMQV